MLKFQKKRMVVGIWDFGYSVYLQGGLAATDLREEGGLNRKEGTFMG
jgi:hypothetical protein